MTVYNFRFRLYRNVAFQAFLLSLLQLSSSLLIAGERIPDKLTGPDLQSEEVSAVVLNPTDTDDPSAAPSDTLQKDTLQESITANQEWMLRVGEGDRPQYLAGVQIHSSEALLQILRRVEQLIDGEASQLNAGSPVVFLLHGKEARSLLQENYRANKALVDLAARLAAFEVVDIKVCEVWMGNQQLDKTELQPFVGTVPFAPAEEKRLIEQQGYQYF